MNKNSLEKFVKNVRSVWGPLDTKLVVSCQSFLKEFVSEFDPESLLKCMKETSQNSAELYQDPEHGFILLAHIEPEGLYRIPHDHGKCWVLYAVQDGEMEMGTYASQASSDGNKSLIFRERYRVTKGQTRVYLPGDVHDTKSLSGNVLMFRFTSCDLKNETLSGKINRYSS